MGEGGQHVMSMVRAKRDRIVGAPKVAPTFLFVQQDLHQSDHIGGTFKMCGLFKGPIRVFRHIPQMRKVDAVRDPLGDGRYVVFRIRPERA